MARLNTPPCSWPIQGAARRAGGHGDCGRDWQCGEFGRLYVRGLLEGAFGDETMGVFPHPEHGTWLFASPDCLVHTEDMGPGKFALKRSKHIGSLAAVRQPRREVRKPLVHLSCLEEIVDDEGRHRRGGQRLGGGLPSHRTTHSALTIPRSHVIQRSRRSRGTSTGKHEQEACRRTARRTQR